MIAQKMLDLAHEAGAMQASVDVTEDYGLSTQVRLGQLETSENNREKSASITIYNLAEKDLLKLQILNRVRFNRPF